LHSRMYFAIKQDSIWVYDFSQAKSDQFKITIWFELRSQVIVP